MDFTISSRVWADPALTSSEKMVLLALDHLGDRDGFSWNGYERLSEVTKISEKSKYLTKIINKLEKAGCILIWRQHGRKGGRGYTHIYWPIIGRTDEEILEIVMRRFFATEEEASAIIGQSGPIYDELIKRNRVSGKTLEDSREIGKGVTKTPIDNEGYTDYTQSDGIGVPETPIDEAGSKKGVPGTPRLLDSSLSSSDLPKDSKELTPNGVSGKPPPPAKKPKAREPSEIPEGVKVYRSLAHLYPEKALWPEIDSTVGAEPEGLKLWHDVVYGYISSGYHKRNIKQMLEYFRRREIPTTQKANTNGHSNTYQRSNQRGSIKALEETGETLKGERTIDTSTREYVYPDGHREPVPPVS